MKKIEAYQAEDGTIFQEEEECLEHEAKVRKEGRISKLLSRVNFPEDKVSAIERFLKMYGKELEEIYIQEGNPTNLILIEKLSTNNKCDFRDVVDALVGITFDEEDGYEILKALQDKEFKGELRNHVNDRTNTE